MGSVLNPGIDTSNNINWLMAQFGRYCGIVVLAGCIIYLFRKAKEEMN